MPPTDAHGPTRATPKVLLVVAGALLVARVALGLVDVVNPDARPELVTWTDRSAAVERARSSGRLLLYAFTDRADGRSRKLAGALFADERAAQQLQQRFVAVRIEGRPGDDDPEVAALRQRFGVHQLPALVVASPDGAKFRTVAGFENAGKSLQDLTEAQMEMMDLPFVRPSRGFQFRFGGGGRHGAPDSLGAGASGEADSTLR